MALLALMLAACERAPPPSAGGAAAPAAVAWPAQVRFHDQGQPPLLSDWGLMQVADGRLRLNAGVLPYGLNSALFTDYAHKLRTVWMPKGSAARYDAQNAFDFPVGTVLSKTFYYPRAVGADGDVVARSDDQADFAEGALDLKRVRLIETRLLVRRAEGWIALPYVWNAEQTQARLMRGGELISLTLRDGQGRDEAATYQVPDQNQCGGCHGTDIKSKALQPIGPKARHLNRDYAYADGRAHQFARWQQAGYLQGAPAAADAPHAADWRDAARASLDARARAYLDINCGHCHSPKGPGNTSGLWLDAATQEPLRLGRCKLPIAAGKGTGDRRHDIVPGDPEASILVYRMDSVDPSAMMPEVGRSVVHSEGVALIREWIAAQQGDCG
ncbi:SO2930 family diheme c-type cytochrome [Lysobacter silvisoli]|uniref:SO2930 family diheme c-type cytochrome n=1 Tax=Lysobacter silvisoli TaxID=2293254 RepID=UPI001E493E14|nr:SO2930 family diheme c-type cytochrome [Lysobacter silvisoli]